MLENLPNWVTIIGLIATGLVAGFGVFDARIRTRRKDENDIEDRVITLLKEQNTQLTVKINDYEQKFTSLNEKVAKVEAQNQLMKEILQGVDKESVDYKQQGRQAMETIQQLAEVAASNGKKTDKVMEAVQATNKNVERLATAIERHLEAELQNKK